MVIFLVVFQTILPAITIKIIIGIILVLLLEILYSSVVFIDKISIFHIYNFIELLRSTSVFYDHFVIVFWFFKSKPRISCISGGGVFNL